MSFFVPVQHVVVGGLWFSLSTNRLPRIVYTFWLAKTADNIYFSKKATFA